MFSLICVWINGWVNNREAGDLRRYRAHCDVIVMVHFILSSSYLCVTHAFAIVQGNVMKQWYALYVFLYS